MIAFFNISQSMLKSSSTSTRTGFAPILIIDVSEETQEFEAVITSSPFLFPEPTFQLLKRQSR